MFYKHEHNQCIVAHKHPITTHQKVLLKGIIPIVQILLIFI